ncbi:MAG: DinB family protein [Chloroflexota bacterium]
MLDTRLSQVTDSFNQMEQLLLQVADDQDWQLSPDEWSFRFLAGHLAVTDRECWLVRIQQLAAGDTSQFETYLNTGRDFQEHTLTEWLTIWRQCRGEIVAYVPTLTEVQLTVSGNHDWFGELTIPRILVEMHNHDLGHIAEMQPAFETCLKQKLR